MDHKEAVQMMAAERYLLDELTPEERDAFEAHYFDCPDCALDLRAGAAFVDEARVQLPEQMAKSPASSPAESKKRSDKMNRWFLSWRPAFAGAAFACLILVLGYQNLVMYPALRRSATEPHIIPLASAHGETRGAGHLTMSASRKTGIALPVDLLGQRDNASYSSCALDLLGPDGKLLWTEAIATAGNGENGDRSYLLVLPGAALGSGLHTIVVSGIAPDGKRTVIDRYAIEIHLTD